MTVLAVSVKIEPDPPEETAGQGWWYEVTSLETGRSYGDGPAPSWEGALDKAVAAMKRAVTDSAT